jgi:hypothetical protein
MHVPSVLLVAAVTQLAAGVGRDGGRYLPEGWRPFSAHRWLAERLMEARKADCADASTHEESGTAPAAVLGSLAHVQQPLHDTAQAHGDGASAVTPKVCPV